MPFHLELLYLNDVSVNGHWRGCPLALASAAGQSQPHAVLESCRFRHRLHKTCCAPFSATSGFSLPPPAKSPESTQTWTFSQFWHCDATMILIVYRHALRVSELTALRWDQVDLAPPIVLFPAHKAQAPACAPVFSHLGLPALGVPVTLSVTGPPNIEATFTLFRCRVPFKSGKECAIKRGKGQKTGQWSRTMGLALGSGAWRR